MVFTKSCAACQGTGRLRTARCGICAGQGLHVRSEGVAVHVPAGVHDGTRLRVPDSGHAGRRGARNGDLYVTIHVLPHALPVALEGLGSGLRISVASLPIVEYIFQWNGIGYIALQSIANRDPAAFTASALVLVTLFALLSFIADVGRPRFAYR